MLLHAPLLTGTAAVSAGLVSFTQVVKAANPVYVCVLSTLVLRQSISRRVWLSLMPIVGGVALATVKEVSFVWAALLGALLSDLAMATRNVLVKRSFSTLADVDGALVCWHCWRSLEGCGRSKE